MPFFDPYGWSTAGQAFLFLHLMAYAAWPWCTRLFSSRKDRGAGLAMSGGIFMYLLAAQLWWRTGLFGLHFVWALFLMICVGISGHYLFSQPLPPSVGTRARMRKAFIQGWLIFSVLFWYWTVIRAGDPGVTHTEQAMDVMWMRAGMASESPPIRDAWFGGEASSYYSDGHQALSFLGLLLGLPVQISVNITQIIWFALTGLLSFQAGKSLFELSGKKGASLAGVLAMLFVCFISTPQGFLSAHQPDSGWWWWKASRVIMDGEFPLITEFPFFSFWLGDNHAHVIGLPFLLLSLVSSIQLLRARTLRFSTVFLPCFLILWSWRINPWQVPTVLAIPLLCLVLRKRRYQLSDLRNLVLATLPGLGLLFPARTGGPEIQLVVNEAGHTNFVEFLKVFGFLIPGVLLVIFQRPHRLWVAVLVLCAGMFACAEFVFLQDVFQNRMNTVFKVYYQIWILAGLLSGVGGALLLRHKGWKKVAGRLLLLCLLIPGLWYAGTLSMAAFRMPRNGLNAWSVLSEEDQIFLEIANLLIEPGERIVEAPGKSYDPHSSRLGTWTAGESLIGWTGHQQQWRPGTAHPTVSQIYEAHTREDLAFALSELQADWVSFGPREQEAFTVHPEWESWMNHLADRVVDQPNQRLYRIR